MGLGVGWGWDCPRICPWNHWFHFFGHLIWFHFLTNFEQKNQMVTVLVSCFRSLTNSVVFVLCFTYFCFWENVSMKKRKKGTKMSSKDKRKDQNALWERLKPMTSIFHWIICTSPSPSDIITLKNAKYVKNEEARSHTTGNYLPKHRSHQKQTNQSCNSLHKVANNIGSHQNYVGILLHVHIQLDSLPFLVPKQPFIYF